MIDLRRGLLKSLPGISMNGAAFQGFLVILPNPFTFLCSPGGHGEDEADAS